MQTIINVPLEDPLVPNCQTVVFPLLGPLRLPLIPNCQTYVFPPPPTSSVVAPDPKLSNSYLLPSWVLNGCPDPKLSTSYLPPYQGPLWVPLIPNCQSVIFPPPVSPVVAPDPKLSNSRLAPSPVHRGTGLSPPGTRTEIYSHQYKKQIDFQHIVQKRFDILENLTFTAVFL